MARRRSRRLVTFEGWDGKWWRRIRVGPAVYEAVSTVFVPWKVSLVIGVAEAVTGTSVTDVLFGKKSKTRGV